MMMRFLQDRAIEILEAAGARRTWRQPVQETTLAAHLLGTCRMGDDPRTSVVDRYHRTHECGTSYLRWLEPRHGRPGPAHRDDPGLAYARASTSPSSRGGADLSQRGMTPAAARVL